MDCWAASLSMLFSWCDDRRYTINSVVQSAQFSCSITNLKKNVNFGLTADKKTRIIECLPLEAAPKLTPTTNWWKDRLKDHGPHWVTIWENYKHSVVLVSIEPSTKGPVYIVADPFLDKLQRLSEQQWYKKFRDFSVRAKGNDTQIMFLSKERRALNAYIHEKYPVSPSKNDPAVDEFLKQLMPDLFLPPDKK